MNRYAVLAETDPLSVSMSPMDAVSTLRKFLLETLVYVADRASSARRPNPYFDQHYEELSRNVDRINGHKSPGSLEWHELLYDVSVQAYRALFHTYGKDTLLEGVYKAKAHCVKDSLAKVQLYCEAQHVSNTGFGRTESKVPARKESDRTLDTFIAISETIEGLNRRDDEGLFRKLKDTIIDMDLRKDWLGEHVCSIVCKNLDLRRTHIFDWLLGNDRQPREENVLGVLVKNAAPELFDRFLGAYGPLFDSEKRRQEKGGVKLDDRVDRCESALCDIFRKATDDQKRQIRTRLVHSEDAAPVIGRVNELLEPSHERFEIPQTPAKMFTGFFKMFEVRCWLK